MKIKPTIRKKLLPCLLVALASSMTLTLSPMLLFLYGNQGEFWFLPEDVLPYVAAFFGLLALGVFVFLMILPPSRKGRLYLAFSGLATGASLCYYIQSTYMTSYLPVMTGDDIAWNSFGAWSVISIALWLGVMAAVAALWIFRPRWLKSAVSVVCAVLLAMESLTLAGTLLTMKHDRPETAAYFTSEGLYDVSGDKNVVVVVSDTFEGTFMNEVLELYPEWKEKLKDFTYYNNTTGTSSFTYFSFTKLLADVDFPLGMNSEQGIAYAFENQTLVDTVVNNGYDVAYYTYFKPTGNLAGKVLNYENSRIIPNHAVKMRLTKLLLKGTLLQGVPHQLKKYFVTLTKDFSDAQSLLVLGDNASPYVENDFLYRDGLLQKGLTPQESKPRYIVYQLYGVHSPYELSRDFNKVTFGEDVPTREKQLEAALGSLKLLTEYLDELKKAGVYDNTTVIFTADHGFDMRFYPVMLVKDAGASGTEMRVDSTPLSHQDDFASLIDAVTSGKTFAQAVDQLNLSENRVRHALDFRIDNGYGEENSMRSVVEITGPAADPASYRVAKEEYALRDISSSRYTLGTSLLAAAASGDAALYGLRPGEDTVRSVYGHTVIADVYLAEETPGELVCTFTAENAAESSQSVSMVVDEQPLAAFELAPGEQLELRAEIPAALTADQHLVIRLEIPDAILLPGATETLGANEYISINLLGGSITAR